jgi:hypothetical protein
MTIERRDISAEEFDEAVEWLQKGIDKGWVSEGFCFTHDGDNYMTEEEEAEWEEGGDPCCPVVKWLV